MLYLLRRPLVRRLICTTVAALAVAAAPSIASACTVDTSSETQAFQNAGDSSWYTLAPSSDFSSSFLPGWTLNNALVQYGFGWGRFPSWLTVRAGGSAISAPFCVGTNTPTMRFWARQADPTTWAEMNVALVWTDANGNVQSVGSGGQGLSDFWSASPVYNLGNELPIWGDQTMMVQVEFLPAAGGSDVEINGLYVDPYSRG